jgi:hypothetical protein
MGNVKESSLGDSKLTGTVTHIQTGQSIGVQSSATSDVGEIVNLPGHGTKGVAGGE